MATTADLILEHSNQNILTELEHILLGCAEATCKPDLTVRRKVEKPDAGRKMKSTSQHGRSKQITLQIVLRCFLVNALRKGMENCSVQLAMGIFH